MLNEVNRPTTPAHTTPETSVAFATTTKLSRHDAHNLDLKIFYETSPSEKWSELDLFLFMPSSLHLGMCDKNDLIRDFHSRLRLSNAVNFSVDSIDDEIAKLKQEIEKWTQDLDFDERAVANERIFSTARHIGAVFGEALKAKASQLKADIFVPQSLLARGRDPSPALRHVAEETVKTQGQVRELRELLRSTPDSFPALVLLDQYLGIQYVDFLSRLRDTLDRFDGPSEGHILLRETLDRLQAAEAWECQSLDQLGDSELQTLHISRLKKFFQSELFIEVTQRQALKRVAEPTAAIAALLAGGMVGGLEHLLKHNGWMLSLDGVVVVCLGMALYALKDRLKDRGRAFLTRKLSKKFPDVERELFVNGKVLGKIREWYSLTQTSKLPDFVCKARHQACWSDLERHLPEEILHYHKSIRCASRSSIREYLRINLHRYLRHMDEPLKKIKRLTPTGQIESVSQPRVYHIYAVIFADGKNIRTHRIVMDKTGIVRCELVSSGSVESGQSKELAPQP